MSLVFKKSFREDVDNANVFIDDKSATSPSYFRVSDVPQILTKGKNLIRISGHPTNLKDGTQVYIDIKDSNGNSIYYEIPDYIEDDKSRVISIWIYHDKGDDNTANGEATITLVGIATKDKNGRTIPAGYRNKINVRWQVKVNVDRDRSSVTPILFNTLVSQPTLSLSESIEVYQNQPQSGNKLNQTTQKGKVRYILKGKTPIVQVLDNTSFNEEMLKSSIVLSNYAETPATPICKKGEPTNLTSFSGSISKLLNSKTAQLNNPYTASFEDREGLKHIYDSIKEADYTIQYVQSGSNISTENERSFVNISFADVDPIVGIVDKIKVLQKSDGLPGEFELLNEVSVPFTSSFSVKIPLPSENLQDPKLLKIQYLNSIGEISRTETTVGPFVFEGGNQYIGGSKNLISGSIFISNTIGTGIEIGGASSGFMRSVGFNGQTSASLGLSPGGFVIYSGSSNLQMGADELQGVGMQMIGDNDDRHFIFSTANGGNLDVKTDKFFIGTTGSQFISGSNNNIEISSSLFHLDPANNSLVIGANATINADLSVNNIFSPAGTNVNSSKAAITAQGFAKFTSASIGGLKLDNNKLFTGTGTYGNANTGFYVDSGSQFALGNKLVWNPTTQALVIRGQLQLSDGSDVGTALAAATSSNTSKTVALGASSYVVTFNSLGNQDPTTQTITLTATQQNHNGTVYYEFRKNGSLQSARGTSNTFVADQPTEKPTASTPVTYEVKTFEVSSGGSAIANDTLTLFGVQSGASGSDGSAGVDAVTAFLTNEAHSFAANPDKSIVSFVGGTTDMEVFEGVTNKTSEYTFTKASTTSVSSSISGKTVTITSMGHDSGSVIVTATKGGTSLSKTMSLVKAIAGQTGSDGSDGAAGADGTSAKLLIGSLDSQVFAFDNTADTSADPLEIFFSFQQQNLTAAIVAGDITATTAGGSNITNFDFNNASISGGTGIVSGSIVFSQALNNGGAAGTKSNLPINISATKDGLQDSVKIFKIEGGTAGSDGQSARTMILTNESHTFASQPNGSIISFTGGSTDVSVFTGTTNTTAAYTISSTSTTSVSSSISSNTVSVTSMGHDSGSLVITAVSASGASGEVTLTKLMSLTKAKQGVDGDDGNDGAAGSNAKTITVNAASQIFVKAQSGTVTPSSIVISANGQNLTAAGAFSTTAGTLTSKTENSSGGSATVTSANFVDGMVVTYTTAGGDGSLTDSVTLKELDEGSGAVSALLTNESHVLPASSVGVVSSYTNSGTSIDVYEGATQLDYDGIGTSNGHWTIGTPTISPAGKITVGSISDSTNTAVVGNHSAMDNSTDSVTITYPISGKTQNGTAFSFNKTQTLTKSKAGTDGTDGNDGVNGTSAKLLTITPNSQVFGFDNSVDTTATPSSIIFTVAQQNLAHTIDTGDITITKAGSSTLSTPSLSGTISGGTGQQTFTVPFSSLTKTDLPLTVSVSNNANNLSDTTKIFKVVGGDTGSDGSAGTDAVSAFLTNEAHTFAALNNGNIVSFVGGSTDMEVFEGVTNVTSNYVISSSRGPGVVASDSGNTVTISALSHDSGSLTITATKGSTSLNKTMSLVKSKQGTAGLAGADAKSVSIVADSQTFAFDNSVDTTATPSSVNFVVNQQNLSGTIATSDITITKAGGSAFTTPTLGGSVSSGTGTRTFALPFSSFSKSDLPLNIAVSKDSLSDSAKIFKIVGGDTGSDGSAGSDAVTAFLTNESHTFAADFSGSIASFTGGTTDMEVFEGVTNKTSEYTFTRASTTSVSSSISGKTVTITSMNHDSGSVVVTATKGGTSLSKTMSVVKSKQGGVGATGEDGTDGSNAKTITVGAASQIFVKAQNGTISPTSIVITANGQNLTANGAFSTTAGTLSSTSVSTSGGSTTVTSANFVDGMVVTYTTAGGDGSLTDSITLKELDEGSGTVSALLTNEAHVLPASSAGVVSSYSDSGTSIDVYEGATQLDYDGSGTTNGHWTIGTPTVSPSGKITVGSISDSTNTAVVANHSSMDNSTDSVTITYPISGKTQNGTSFSFNKTQTITKSKAGSDGTDGNDGAAGANAQTVTVNAASQIFVKAQDGTITPSSIVITANGQNLTQNGAFSTTAGTLTSTSVSTSGGSTTVTSGNFSNGMVITYTAHSNDGSITDSVTLKELDEGSGAITALLENEAHILPANSSGVVSSYSNSGTKISVFEGATALDYDGTGTADGHWTVSTSQSPSSTITIGNISDSTNDAVVANHSSMVNGTDSVTITYTISGKTLNGTDFSFTKTQTLTKSKAGATGAAGSDSKTVSLTAASNVITYNAAGSSPSPSSTITLTATSQNFTNGFFKFTGDGISDEGSFTNGSGANSDTFSFTVPSSYFSTPKSIRVGVSEANQSELAFDTVSIVAVQPGSDGSAGAPGSDGTSAITAFLTSDGDIVPAANDGTVSSFAGSGTEMIIFQGVTDVSSAYNTVTRTNSTGVTSALSGKTLTISGLTQDSGTVIITATSASGDAGQLAISKTYSIGKSKAGATGTAGSNAKTIAVGAASQIFVKAQDGTLSPNSIVITANGQNLTQAGDFTTTAGSLTSVTENTSGGSVTVLKANFVDGMVVTYTTDSADGSLTDSITLKELDAGSGTVSALLTNESHVLPASSAGVVSSYTNSGTSIEVYEGATQLDYDGSGTTNGHWTIGTPTVSPTNKITVGSISDSTNTAVVADHSSMNNGINSVTISYPISGKTQNGTDFSFTKTQTITKSKAGSDGSPGSNAKTVTVGASSNIFVKAQNGTLTPSSITITANGQNLTANGAFSNVGGTLSSTSVSTSGGSTTVTSGNFSNGMVVTYTSATADGSITDSVTLNELDEGSGNITAILDNEAHVLPASATGAVSSYANSGTTIRCFEGATALAFVTGTPGTGEFGVSVGNTANITEGSITDSGTFCTIGNHSGAADGTDQYVITYTISGKTLNGTDFTTFTKTQSLTKSKVGATGPQGNAGDNNQDFSFLDASLSSVSVPLSAGLLMTSNVFGFHNAIDNANPAALSDFTSFLDSGGNFYLGGNSSGASNPTDGYFAWNNVDKSLLISGSKARVDVDKFFVGKSTTQFISGSNGNIEISSSKFHIKPDGDIIVKKVTADDGTIGGFTLSSNALTATNFELNPSGKRITLGTGTNIFIADGDEGIQLGHGTFASAPFSVTKAGALKATSGTIGGFTLSSNALTATNFELNPSGKRITLGTGNNIFIADGDDGIQLGHATFASAPFSVTKAGALKATSGTIGGFELTSTQINSTNDNLILKASGQVTASTLLLTGGKVAGMPVSSDEIAVGEVLKLKQSGQITGSSVQFSGGNIGGFQLENSSLFQGSGNNLIVSASFKIKPRFGDSGDVPTFEYEPRIGDVSFYIDDIISNLPDEDLGLILKSDSIISGSKVSGGVSALFSSGSDYYNNSTHLAIVDSYDPVSKLLTLKPGLVLGHGADAFYQNPQYTQRRIFIVDGVTYSTGVQIGNAFNQSSKTTSFSIAQKDTSNLILSSSGELKAQSGNIGDFTISKSDIELITSIETKTELPDFRVYNSTTLPSDARNYDQASDNGGIPLRLYIKKPNNQYYDGWEVNKITTAGSNGSDAGFGNYIAIKSSASSSLNNNLAPIVYTRSELTALGINNTPWPYNDSQGASGYSYVPATTNTLGENENWYLEYFTAPTTVNGVSSGGIASGYPSFENALVSFLSQSIDDAPIKFTVLAHTASFVCRAESSDRAEAGLWINTEASFIQGVASELQNLPENNFQQAIMIDGGGTKAGGFGISTTSHITNGLLSIPNATKTNFWQNPNSAHLYSPLGWPTKAGFSLTTEMHIDLRLINSFTSSITTGYLKNNDNASNYWNTTNQNNEKISDILKFPFLFSEELANDGASAQAAYSQLFEKMNDLFPANGWSNVESLKGNLSILGMKLAQTASISIVPYANVIGGFLSTDGDPAENKPYMANVSYNESTFGFPLFATGSEQGPAGFTDTRNTAQPGRGKHIAVLEKGFFLNPLWDKALSYSGNGVTGHVYEGELEAPGNYNSNDVAWTRYVGNYNNLYATTEGAVAGMGLPFSIVHSYVTGSSLLTSKAILKNAIYPDTIAIRGQIVADNDEEGANIGFELNNWLNSGYSDRTITSRISDTVINTNLSNSELNSFKSTFGNRAYTGVRFHFNHNVKKRFGDGTIRMGTTSGSFSEGSVLKISGSGAISSSNYFQKADGTVTGSKVSFLGGKISGSDMSITANEFDFKTDFGNLKGNSTTFELSSSLLNLTPKSLNVKGNIQAEQVYGQDTFLAGKIVSTGVTNPTFPTVKYNFPFVEVYSTESLDVRLATGSFLLKSNGRSTSFLAHTGSTIQGNHKTFTLSSGLHSTPQFLIPTTNDGVGYPSEFKSWRDISGVNNDYVFVSNVSATNASEASGSLGSSLIGNQLVLNHATSSQLLFNSASNAFNSITTDTINLYEILNSERENVNIQFAIRGTAHPSTGSFNGYNPEYKVEVLDTSGSAVVWQKSYKDTNATHKNWAVFDIPMTDIATYYQQNIPFNSSTGSIDEGSYNGTLDDGLKLKISMRYSGSNRMSTRLSEGTRFGGRNTANGSFTLGFALTEIRMVEPVRITSLDTQTVHFKDTYMTWHDNPATTGHYGNFVPEFTSSATTSSFALGAPKEKWDEVYLNLKQDNVVSSSVSGVENKFVRMDIHSGRLSFTSASAGSGGGGVSSYSLPLAAAGTRGGVKIGYSENGKYYPVELSSEKMYVHVPWTDTNTQIANTNYYLDGITKSSNTLTFSVNGATNQTYTFGSNAFNSTAYLTSLPSHNHDDRYYTETEMQTFFNRGYINHQQASNLSVGWYTIAQNTGDRALGEFQIWDTYSGRHQSVVFNAAHHFGMDDSNSITVLANSSYSTDVFRYIRIKENGTYDGAAIQVYIDNGNNDAHVAIVGANAQESGWVLVDWLADAESPSLIDNWSGASEKSKIDLDIIHSGGIATTGKIYAGGATSQYEVYHTNNLTPLTIGTTATTALAGNTTIPSNTFRTVTVDTTGNGSANATLGSTETLMLKKGSNISLSESAGVVTISATDNNTTYTTANSTTLGLVKIGYTELGKNYPVELSSGKMYVNVPWTDNNTTYSAGTGITLTDTEFALTDTNSKLNLTGGTLSGDLTLSKTVGDTVVIIESDTDNNNENDNPRLEFKQDAGSVYMKMGTTGNANNPFTNALVNHGYVRASVGLQFVVGATTSAMVIASTGDVTVSSLTGTGNRMVITNASGVLSTQAIPTDTNTVTSIRQNTGTYRTGEITLQNGSNVTVQEDSAGVFDISATNTTYTAGGDYGLTLSGTQFRLEDDRRRNSSTTDIKTGNTHDYTWYDASHGIRWYTSNAEEMRLENDGDLHVDGDVIAFSSTVSDERLKDNIFTIKNPLDKIKGLRGVEYDWNSGSRKGKHDLGLIAQEVEKVIPEIVHNHTLPLMDDSDTVYKTVDYEKLTAVLIESVKEQSNIIEKLEERIKNLEKGSNN